MRFSSVPAILAAVLLAACSGKGSAPSSTSVLATQLVGHWANPSNDQLFFGAADAGSHTGSFVLVHPDGKAFNHQYRLEAEDAGDRSLKITMLFATGDSRETTYIFSSDGKSMESITEITGIETRGLYNKVDEATAP
jgi:hypothetical protein